jgi:hypothetical protein
MYVHADPVVTAAVDPVAKAAVPEATPRGGEPESERAGVASVSGGGPERLG